MVVLAHPHRFRLAAHFAAAAWALCFVPSRAGIASERRAARFEVTRSPEAGDCPDAAGLAAAVARVADPSDTVSSPRVAIPLEVSFTRDESGYVATVRERAIGAERTLVTHGPCSALAEALAAAIALILDSPEEDAAAPAAPVSVPDLHAKRPPDPPSSSPPAAAPDDPSARTAANVVFAEVLGSGLAYSINYERFFGDDASVRVGFGYVRARDANPTFSFSTLRWGTDTQFSFPILANYYYLGHPNHNMHFAAGTTILYRTGQLVDGWYSPANSVYGPEATAGFNLLVNLVIGYRYVPRAGGFTFGGDFMVLFNTVGPLPWCGVNAGAVF